MFLLLSLSLSTLRLHCVVTTTPADGDASIPGLDFSPPSQTASATARFLQRRKIPYAKPIPKDFESAWAGGKQPLAITRSRVANGEPTTDPGKLIAILTRLENTNVANLCVRHVTERIHDGQIIAFLQSILLILQACHPARNIC